MIKKLISDFQNTDKYEQLLMFMKNGNFLKFTKQSNCKLEVHDQFLLIKHNGGDRLLFIDTIGEIELLYNE